MQTRATVTTRSTVCSGGEVSPGISLTRIAAATSISAGTGTLILSVSRLDKMASRPATAAKASSKPNCSLADI